jgi:ABC-type hemin transport system ATPase subunit
MFLNTVAAELGKTPIRRKCASAKPRALNANLLKLSASFLGLFVVSMGALPAHECDLADAAETRCPPLLMENECRVYIERMAGAATAAERERVIAAYDRLVHEREQICPCTPNDGDWIRLKQQSTKTSKTVNAGLKN